ncbi:MAG: hypothetical protein H0W20_01850 [Chthoniobacterales bacterium]|nr:hypothetical protein [Chthoniobacterales bacterium]
MENLISIYRYWRTLPRNGNPLHEYFLAHNLGILEAARLPLLRYLISRTYFGGFDMDRFSFIGTMEHYSADVRRLSKIIGRPLPEMRQNVTAEVREAGAAGGVSDLTSGSKINSALYELLRDDIAFYERTLELPAAQRGE